MKHLFYFILLSSLLLLSGCRLILAIILIPIKIVVGVCAVVALVLVGSDHMNHMDELYAGGIRIDQQHVELKVDSDLTFQT